MSIKSWLIFCRERFEPVSHLAMVGLFYAAHVQALQLVGTALSKEDIATAIAVGIGTLIFFFKLRLYDEIKDYETDVVINPTRPLPRGLLTRAQVLRAIVVCIVLEIVLFGFAGIKGLVTAAIAIAYSLLMFREFFIPQLIRPHLTTYAVTHTVVSSLISLTVFSSLSRQGFIEIPTELLLFSLNSWFLFNVFEFGRKTFASNEERAGVPTYSNIFGRPGSVVLTLSQAALSTLTLLAISRSRPMIAFLAISLIALALAGLIFVVKNDAKSAKLYRALSSVYIVLIFLGFLLCS